MHFSLDWCALISICTPLLGCLGKRSDLSLRKNVLSMLVALSLVVCSCIKNECGTCRFEKNIIVPYLDSQSTSTAI